MFHSWFEGLMWEFLCRYGHTSWYHASVGHAASWAVVQSDGSTALIPLLKVLWSIATDRNSVVCLWTLWTVGCFCETLHGIKPFSKVKWARVKRRSERLQLRSAITTQNMWFTVCSDRGPYVAIPLFRLCLWLKLPVGRMTFQSFDVRMRHWSSRSGLVFLGSCKMACRQVYMR